MERRSFLKGLAGVTATGVVSTALPFKIVSAKPADHNKNEQGAEPDHLAFDKTGWGACTVDCGSRCPLQIHVKDGRIKFVETDNTTDDDEEFEVTTQVRACVRGRSTRFRVNNPNRLKYPLKRIGKRGEGKFKRITWEEAFKEIADNMKKVKEKYGNEAFYLGYGTGTLGGTMSKSWPADASVFARLMNLFGGFTDKYGDYSCGDLYGASDIVFGGGWADSSDISEIANSDLFVSFGENIVETRMSGGGHNYYFTKALEKNNTKFISVDPRYSDTTVNKAQQWIALRPGTDASLIAGMIHVMITEKLHNQAFLDKYCLGFDEHTLPKSAPANSSYHAYIMGKGADGIEKTPEWASKICGVSPKVITAFARELASAKNPYICQGWSVSRHSNGEENSRAIMLLAAVLGSMGRRGTSTGARTNASGSYPVEGFPVGTNPVKQSISFYTWVDAITRWNEMTALTDGVQGAEKLKAPIKFLWHYGSNPVNQHGDANHTAKVLQDESLVEFIVDVNITGSSSVKYADIVLPDATHHEQMDIAQQGQSSGMNYVIMANEAVKPLWDTKTAYDMATGIAKELGLEKEFTEGKTQKDWVESLWKSTMVNAKKAGLNPPTFEEMQKKGIHKDSVKAPHKIAYKAFINNPRKNKLSTPSGKIEIYSLLAEKLNKKLTFKNGESISVLPIHVNRFDNYNPDDATMKDFPLQMLSVHAKSHVRSTYYEIDAIREVNPQGLWINPIDAKSRGIQHGEKVHVYNKRGKIEITAKVTTRVRPGVLYCDDGATYNPDSSGVDKGGCMNTLTSNQATVHMKANGQHSNLVQVEKV